MKVPILTFYEGDISSQSFYPKKFYFFLKNFYFNKIYSKIKKKNYNEFSYLMSHNIYNYRDIAGTNIIYGKDYILHHANKLKKKSIKNKIVFLDQNWGNNEDYKIYYSQSFLKKFNLLFYGELISFLKNIEKEYKTKITILLHPMSEKKDWKIYKNFRTSINKTPSEIKNADLVIGFWSLSLKYAIILKKKLLILNSKHLKMTKNYHFAKFIAEWFKNSMPLLISEKFFFKKIEIESHIISPNSKFDDYKNSFLLTKKPTHLNFSGVIKKILTHKV